MTNRECTVRYPEPATCKEFLQVRQEGLRPVRRSLKHFSVDMILAVGFRRAAAERVYAPHALRFRVAANLEFSKRA